MWLYTNTTGNVKMFNANQISSIYLLQRGGVKFLYDCYTITVWVNEISDESSDNIKAYLMSACENTEWVSTDEITHIMSSLLFVICNSVRDSLSESYNELNGNVSVKNEPTCVNNIYVEISYEILLKSKLMKLINFNPMLEKPMKIMQIRPICMISGKTLHQCGIKIK